MGVATKAILRKGVSIEEIEKVLSEKYSSVNQITTYLDGYFSINFKDGIDNRQLLVSFSNSCEKDNGISGVWCSLGMWGNSVEILRNLCEIFGGYLDEKDCDDAGFYPINYHLYVKGLNATPIELFRKKVIQQFGYDKEDAIMSLFEEFKTLDR